MTEPPADMGTPVQRSGASLGRLAPVIALLLVGCEAGASPPPGMSPTAVASVSPRASASAVSSSGPPTVTLEELDPLTVRLDGGPDWPTGLDGSVWILAPDGPLGPGGQEAVVYRLDPSSGEELAQVPIDGRLCQGIAAGYGSIWACTDTGLARIDPASNEVVAQVAFDAAQVFARPAMGKGRVWSLAGNVVADQVVEIDPATNEVVSTHDLGHVAASIAFGDGALWATVPGEGLLLRVDPATGEVTVHARQLAAPWSVSFGAGSLWIGLYGEHGGAEADPGEPTIARVSAGDGTVEALIDIGSTTTSEGDLWAMEDAVWVRGVGDPFLMRIDPGTDEVAMAIAGFQSGGSVAVIDGSVWTTSIEFATVWRIDP